MEGDLDNGQHGEETESECENEIIQSKEDAPAEDEDTISENDKGATESECETHQEPTVETDADDITTGRVTKENKEENPKTIDLKQARRSPFSGTALSGSDSGSTFPRRNTKRARSQTTTEDSTHELKQTLVALVKNIGRESSVAVRLIVGGILFEQEQEPSNEIFKSRSVQEFDFAETKTQDALGTRVKVPGRKKLSYRDPDSDDIGSEASVDKSETVPQQEKKPGRITRSTVLGDDGNKFFCQICTQTGNIVCCDGCPNVYHSVCLPDGKSKRALELDEDPWYCPDCLERQKEKIDKKQTSVIGRGRLFLPTRSKTKKESPVAISNVIVSGKRKRTPAAWATMITGNRVVKPSLAPGAKNLKATVEDEEDCHAKNKESGEKQKGSKKKKETKKKRKQKPVSRIRIATSTPPIKPTPPFFLFLQDNLSEIVGKRLRKNYLFQALPEGYSRNKIIAREGAILWSRLSDDDKHHYRKEAALDFEDQLKVWRRRGRSASEGPTQNQNDASLLDEHADQDVNDEYHKVKKRVSQHFEVTTKSLNKRDGGANKILLEILQDHRFHPIPMLHPKRDREAFGFTDYSKVTVPCFEVQCPLSTSIGDDCLGCVRGWCHFCPVLKRQFPAVEHRSKLQPPLCSIVATRIGVGLSGEESTVTLPDVVNSVEEIANTESSISEKEEIIHKDTSEALDQPHSRFDDIFEFVEDCLALKVPMTQESIDNANIIDREAETESEKNEQSNVVADDGTGISSNDTFYKCKCGRSIHSASGCLVCKRSLLVSFFARKKAPSRSFQPEEEEELDGSSLLKLQTSMLPRVLKGAGGFEKQKDGDRAIALVLMGEEWKPNAIMPDRFPSHLIQNVPLSPSKQRSQSLPGVSNGVEVVSNDALVLRPRPSPGNACLSLPRRKLRSANTSVKKEKQYSEHDRTAILQAHKDKEVEIQRKTSAVAISGIFLALVQRDPQRLFAEPVPEGVTEYHKVILQPMDFKTIRKKILENQYNLQSFSQDVRLLCCNSMAFNPPGSIYSDTAKYLLESLEVMLKRATEWMTAIKNTHKNSFHAADPEGDDAFADLRSTWPGAVELMDEIEWFRSQVRADFVRTRENEGAYYGSLAIRRAAAAAATPIVSMRVAETFSPCVLRTASEDELLRCAIDERVSRLSKPVRSLDEPGWREQALLKLLRKVQSKRVEKRIASKSGCARCDGVSIEEEAKLAMTIEAKKKDGRNAAGFIKARVASSRLPQSTGLGSQATMSTVSKDILDGGASAEDFSNAARTKAVSVQGSGIHGWGLFADQPLNKGEVVAEYVGEYVVNSVADAREKMYQERRIQDYQFRVSHNLVIDATLNGGYARYINHSCNPNCVARIIDGDPPRTHLKKVIVTAERDIAAMEEITYDYQFPLEDDLDARIPCNCCSSLCRGFMNWDLPEKGSSAREIHADAHRTKHNLGKVISSEKRSKKF